MSGYCDPEAPSAVPGMGTCAAIMNAATEGVKRADSPPESGVLTHPVLLNGAGHTGRPTSPEWSHRDR